MIAATFRDKNQFSLCLQVITNSLLQPQYTLSFLPYEWNFLNYSLYICDNRIIFFHFLIVVLYLPEMINAICSVSYYSILSTSTCFAYNAQKAHSGFEFFNPNPECACLICLFLFIYSTANKRIDKIRYLRTKCIHCHKYCKYIADCH